MVTYEAHRVKADIARLSALKDVPGLIGLLTHPEQMVRFHSAWALGKLGDARAYPHLVRLLDDPVPEVVRWAVTALAEFGDPRAVVPMVEACSRHHSTWLTSRVVHAIQELGEQACLPYLMPLLERPTTRDQAAKRLVDIGAPALAPLMQLSHKEDPALLKTIVRVLGQIGTPEAREHLRQLETRSDPSLAPSLQAALQALESAQDLLNTEQLARARELEAEGDLEQAAHIFENLGLAGETQRIRALPQPSRRGSSPAQVRADFFGGSGGTCQE